MTRSNSSLEFDEYTILAISWKNGEQRAGEQIFDHFAPQIFRFYMVRTYNRDISEDLTQNVFLKVTNKIQSFDEKLGTFSSWIWQIARNSLIDHFREKKYIVFSDIPSESDNFINEKDDPTHEIREAEILTLVKRLSREEQEVFSLHHISSLSYKEISVRMRKSEGALRVLVHRINRKLRAFIRKENSFCDPEPTKQ